MEQATDLREEARLVLHLLPYVYIVHCLQQSRSSVIEKPVPRSHTRFRDAPQRPNSERAFWPG